ncbi:HAD family hydrolase [Clostridium cagae]|uniref:HAD family hydrolase n=1 Tax=Clostridium cagae TaxID=2080751 RepID=UPI003F776FE4
MKNKLAIFDLDGTLFDTRNVNYYAYKEALKQYNYKLDYDYFVTKCNGRHYTEFLPIIMGTVNNIEEIHHLKKNIYKNYLDKAIVNIHLFNMIKYMSEEYYIVLVTTASKKNSTEILKQFGKYDLFELIISHEDVIKVKPNPEGFYKAMEYYNILPFNTIIYEDSEVGIKAALKSGATVIKVEKF